MHSTLSFPARNIETAERAISELGKRLNLGRPETRVLRETELDTFDWRLHAAGWRLVAIDDRKQPRLRIERTGPDGEVATWTSLAPAPSWPRELQDETVRDALAKVVRPRRLLPQITVDCQEQIVPVLDEDQKTIAHLATVRSTATGATGESRDLPLQIEARPVRGYDKAFRTVTTHLEATLGTAPGGPLLERALDAVGRHRGDYSPKLRVDLDPAVPAAQAIQSVLATLLNDLLINEAGTRDALDPEFLHDFRVAGRRARSLLGQAQGVLPEAARRDLLRSLSWLGSVTGPARDLDVLLDDFDDWRADLPADWAADLAPLERALAAQRAVVQDALCAALDGTDYRRVLEQWRRIVSAAETTDGEAAASVRTVAARRLRRLGRKVAKRGAAVDHSSPAEEVHRLRIAGKKLRYWIEFFRTMLPKTETRRLLRRLKAVQDRLGRWHDLEQQRFALTRAADLVAQTDEPRARVTGSLLALGRLMARVDQQHDEARSHVHEGVDRLVRELTPRRLDRLTASEPDDTGAT